MTASARRLQMAPNPVDYPANKTCTSQRSILLSTLSWIDTKEKTELPSRLPIQNNIQSAAGVGAESPPLSTDPIFAAAGRKSAPKLLAKNITNALPINQHVPKVSALFTLKKCSSISALIAKGFVVWFAMGSKKEQWFWKSRRHGKMNNTYDGRTNVDACLAPCNILIPAVPFTYLCDNTRNLHKSSLIS